MRASLSLFYGLHHHGHAYCTQERYLPHINRYFNQELQADFLVVRIHDEMYDIFNMIDMATRYGELLLPVSRSADQMI